MIIPSWGRAVFWRNYCLFDKEHLNSPIYLFLLIFLKKRITCYSIRKAHVCVYGWQTAFTEERLLDFLSLQLNKKQDCLIPQPEDSLAYFSLWRAFQVRRLLKTYSILKTYGVLFSIGQLRTGVCCFKKARHKTLKLTPIQTNCAITKRISGFISRFTTGFL